MLGVSWQQLSYNQHRRVDTDTLEWVRINRPCVVEGRYLELASWRGLGADESYMQDSKPATRTAAAGNRQSVDMPRQQ